MDTEEPLINEGCYRESTERLHTGFIHALAILVQTWTSVSDSVPS